MEVSFCPCTKKEGGALLHRVIAKQQAKTEQILLCVYMQWEHTKLWRALIHRKITEQRVKNEQTKRKHLFFVFCKFV